MAKTIGDQIAALQAENEQLKYLQKLFEKAIKEEFGTDSKNIHKMIEKDTNFEEKIAAYFGLKSTQDFEDFLAVFCSESSLSYFRNHRKQ